MPSFDTRLWSAFKAQFIFICFNSSSRNLSAHPLCKYDLTRFEPQSLGINDAAGNINVRTVLLSDEAVDVLLSSISSFGFCNRPQATDALCLLSDELCPYNLKATTPHAEAGLRPDKVQLMKMEEKKSIYMTNSHWMAVVSLFLLEAY